MLATLNFLLNTSWNWNITELLLINAHLNPLNGIFSDKSLQIGEIEIFPFYENLKFPRNVAAEGFELYMLQAGALLCQAQFKLVLAKPDIDI